MSARDSTMTQGTMVNARVQVATLVAGLLALVIGATPEAFAQAAQAGAGRGAQPAAARSAQSDAPIDLTGYWVSIVSDEWRYRMLTPPKGNVDYVPLNAEGRRLAAAWDPARDEAAGEACRGYGAGAIMRLPSRLRISWQDPTTLKIDIDTGTQTRLLRFGPAQQVAAAEPSWQGTSRAEWEMSGGGRAAPGAPRAGQLKAVTTNMRPGYIRKNGVPYSADAVLTEYMIVLGDAGTEYLAVTTMLDDPRSLTQPWVRTSQFKKQANAAGWAPTPCSAR